MKGLRSPAFLDVNISDAARIFENCIRFRRFRLFPIQLRTVEFLTQTTDRRTLRLNQPPCSDVMRLSKSPRIREFRAG